MPTYPPLGAIPPGEPTTLATVKGDSPTVEATRLTHTRTGIDISRLTKGSRIDLKARFDNVRGTARRIHITVQMLSDRPAIVATNGIASLLEPNVSDSQATVTQ